MAQEQISVEVISLLKDQGFKDLISNLNQVEKELDHVRKAQNNLDVTTARAGKKIREQRANFTQLGVQLNQFGTQVATGTSFATAFTQQIGDVGFALSTAGGAVGRFGSLLAGPLGIILGLASFALPSLISRIFDTNDALSKSEQVTQTFERAMNNAKNAVFNYKLEVADTREEVIALYKAHLAGLEWEWLQASMDVEKYGTEVRRTQKILDRWASTGLIKVGKAYFDNKSALDSFNESQEKERDLFTQLTNGRTAFQRVMKGFEREDQSRAKSAAASVNKQIQQSEKLMQSLMAEINVYTAQSESIGKVQNKLDDFIDAQRELQKLPGGTEFLNKNKESLVEVEAALRKKISTLQESADGITQWNKTLADSANSVIPEYQQKINKLREDFAKLTPAKQLEEQQNLNRAIGDQGVKALEQYAQRYADFGSNITDAERDLNRFNELIMTMQQNNPELIDNEELQRSIELIRGGIVRAVDAADPALQDLARSYQAVAMSIADGFQGMITGAQSFKDAMGNIIKAVIAELFRLFVVQQIVGMAVGGFNSVFGTNVAIPGRAIGGQVQAGQPYMVGERGPELFVPARSGSIVPNNKMGGGVVINVDARGSSDPAAVRAQVQQGILEAAPFLIQAAENRTISSVRRPKLPGVIF